MMVLKMQLWQKLCHLLYKQLYYKFNYENLGGENLEVFILLGHYIQQINYTNTLKNNLILCLMYIKTQPFQGKSKSFAEEKLYATYYEKLCIYLLNYTYDKEKIEDI